MSKPSPGISSDLIGMMMKNGPEGIVGSGLTRGPVAGDRRLIADTEAEFRALWESFHPSVGAGSAIAAVPSAARTSKPSSMLDSAVRPDPCPRTPNPDPAVTRA